MSGEISYEILVTNATGETEATRYASKGDARLEVERIRRFHPDMSARIEVLQDEREEEVTRARSPRDFECPHCKAPAGSPCKRPSEHAIPFGDFHAARKKRVAPAHPAPPDDPSERLVCCPRAIHLLLCHLCGRRAVAQGSLF